MRWRPPGRAPSLIGKNKMSQSILARITPDQIVYDPYPHICIRDALAPDYYAELDAAYPHLETIAQRATGYDSIDLAAAAKHGVKVFNVPEYGSRTVAEFLLFTRACREEIHPSKMTRCCSAP